MSAFSELLVQATSDICVLSMAQVACLEQHYELLLRWNQRMSLTSVRGLEDMVTRHYAESLLLGACLPREAATVVDLGSGPGFPGIPVAVMRPDVTVSLVESNARKCVFLREAARGLSNVEVIESRAEDMARSFDFVISRAVNWKGLAGVLAGLGAGVLLLIGEEDATMLSQSTEFHWEPVRKLPWGRQRCILEGRSRIM